MQHPQQHHQQPQPVPTSWEPETMVLTHLNTWKKLFCFDFINISIIEGKCSIWVVWGGDNVFTFICIVDILTIYSCHVAWKLFANIKVDGYLHVQAEFCTRQANDRGQSRRAFTCKDQLSGLSTRQSPTNSITNRTNVEITSVASITSNIDEKRCIFA